jgi:hypothetical protein
METKNCKNCNNIKDLDKFYKNKARHDGVDVYCKICTKERRKARLQTDEGRQKHNEYAAKWREQNKEKNLEYHRRYRTKHADKLALKRKSAEGREYNKNYMRNKRKNPAFRLHCNVSRNVHHAMRRSGGSKRGEKTFDALPYTPQQLCEHLEAQFDENMTWNNYGSYWHIDHIYPQSMLPYDSYEHPNFLKCWNLSNLRPLEASANIAKGAKIQ